MSAGTLNKLLKQKSQWMPLSGLNQFQFNSKAPRMHQSSPSWPQKLRDTPPPWQMIFSDLCAWLDKKRYFYHKPTCSTDESNHLPPLIISTSSANCYICLQKIKESVTTILSQANTCLQYVLKATWSWNNKWRCMNTEADQREKFGTGEQNKWYNNV